MAIDRGKDLFREQANGLCALPYTVLVRNGTRAKQAAEEETIKLNWINYRPRINITTWFKAVVL